MKRHLKRFFAIFVSIIATFSTAFAFGCSNKGGGDENTLEIYFWRSGLGEDFILDIIEEFKKVYPQYSVKYDRTTWEGTITNYFGLGADVDTYDLWMFDGSGVVSKFDKYAEPLNDILETNSNNESKKIGEKLNQSVLSLFKFKDENYYSLPYGGGYLSIIYDASVIDGKTYKVPYTSKDLEYLVEDLMSDYKGGKPFMNFKQGGYWQYIYNVWQAQYDGYEYFNNTFLSLTDETGKSPSKEIILREDGRKKALDALEAIVTPSTIVNGSNALDFTAAQTRFLNKEAVMMPNGGWLMNEMKSTGKTDVNYAMMKVPVLSAIRDKCPSIGNDKELHNLIMAIDNYDSYDKVPLKCTDVKNPYDVTVDDMKRVYEARNMISSSYTSSSFIVPKYSNAKQAAKDFIKFYYSDKCLNIYFNKTRILPVASLSSGGFDETGMTDWEKNMMNFGKSSIPISTETANKNALFLKSRCHPYANIDVITALSNSNSKDRKTASELWTMITDTLSSQWNDYLSDAGLL